MIRPFVVYTSQYPFSSARRYSGSVDCQKRKTVYDWLLPGGMEGLELRKREGI